MYRVVRAGRCVGGGWIRLWRELPYGGRLRDAPHRRMNPGLFLGLRQTLNISLATPLTYSVGVFDGNNGFTDVNYCSRIPPSVLLSELILAGKYCAWRQGFAKYMAKSQCMLEHPYEPRPMFSDTSCLLRVQVNLGIVETLGINYLHQSRYHQIQRRKLSRRKTFPR